MTKDWDIFISYASEDRRALALPLAAALEAQGLSVWIDYGELTLGDGLRQRISDGLARSRFAVVILSRAFLAKPWPMSELQALMAREEAEGKVLLPIRYDITQQELASAYPFVAARLSIGYEDGLEKIVHAILSVVRPAGARVPTTWAVDFSHGQDDWDNLSSFFEGKRFFRITGGLQEQKKDIEAASLLVMPPPRKKRLERPELDLLKGWVAGGGGLLLMGCYAERHHEGNISELAWRLDLEFLDNLVMPPGWVGDPRSMARSIDRRFAVRCDPACPRTHAVMESVHELAFVSAASVRPTTLEKPELIILSEPNSSLFRPLGRIGADGSRPAIDEYLEDGVGGAPLLVAKRHGRGRVVAVGTWKLCTADYNDNFKLIENAFRWLSASAQR